MCKRLYDIHNIFQIQIWFDKCNYLRLKMRVVCVGRFLKIKCLLIEFVNFCNMTVQNGFWVPDHILNLCSGVMNSQRLFCIEKAFCSTKLFVFYIITKQCNLKYKVLPQYLDIILQIV